MPDRRLKSLEFRIGSWITFVKIILIIVNKSLLTLQLLSEHFYDWTLFCEDKWSADSLKHSVYIGLSGKFVPILKENWNAEDLNFSIHLLNCIGAILFFHQSIFLHLSGNLKIPSFQNLSGFSTKNFSKWFFFYLDQRVEAFSIKGIL